jgi:hypothetical protein
MNHQLLQLIISVNSITILLTSVTVPLELNSINLNEVISFDCCELLFVFCPKLKTVFGTGHNLIKIQRRIIRIESTIFDVVEQITSWNRWREFLLKRSFEEEDTICLFQSFMVQLKTNKSHNLISHFGGFSCKLVSGF